MGVRGGLIGIPLVLIISSWFFKYAFILFDHASRGFDEPPVLDIKMLNPVDEQRPLAQLVIILLMIGAAYWIHTAGGPISAVCAGTFFVLVLPASVAVLGLESNILKAIYPVAWLHMIKGLGVFYIVVLAQFLFGGLIIVLLDRLALWPSIQIALEMFGVLSVFSVLGGAVFERREQLGIQTWTSPEQRAEKQRKEDHAQSEKLVHDAYGLMRAGEHLKCWELLQHWLGEHDYAIDAYPWLCESVTSWDDPRYLKRLTEDHIERLLSSKRTGEALNLVAERLKLDPTFRPKTPASTLKIAQLAALGGGTLKVARTLSSDFAERFPGDPLNPAVAALAQTL